MPRGEDADVSRRIVKDDALRRAIGRACDAELSGEDADRVSGRVLRWLGRQPSQPDLVGPKRAAEILGVRPPNLVQMRERGRVPESAEVQVEGSASVYWREDVEQVADDLQKMRTDRANRRREREEQAAAEAAAT